MRSRFIPLLCTAAVICVVVTTIVRARTPYSPGRLPAPDEAPPAPTFAPSKSNVSSAFHAEVAALRDRLGQFPDDTLSLVRMAQVMESAHRPAEAVPYYRRYLIVNPQSREGWLGLAEAHGALGQWAAAATAMRSLLGFAPGDGTAMYNLGVAYANRGRLEQARRWWSRVNDEVVDSRLAGMAKTALTRIDSIGGLTEGSTRPDESGSESADASGSDS